MPTRDIKLVFEIEDADNLIGVGKDTPDGYEAVSIKGGLYTFPRYIFKLTKQEACELRDDLIKINLG